MSLPVAHAIQGRFFAKKIPDEAYYAQAAHEVKNKIISEGLWAKAWSDAEGDEVKAQALYIKYRVEDLRRQAAGKFSEYAKEYGGDVSKVIIQCQRCGANLRVAAGKRLDVRCPKCGAEFRTATAFPPMAASYGRNFARYIYAVGACIGVVIAFAVIWSVAADLLRQSTIDPILRALIKGGIIYGMIHSCISAWKAIVRRHRNDKR
jgi:hypothetical protein